MIRGLLVEGEEDRWAPFTETLLHIAARYEHISNTVRPALEAGSWVVCDRFLDSTKAYQGYGLGQNLSTIDEIHELVLPGIVPNLTLLIDLDVRMGLNRTQLRGDQTGTRYEEMDIDFHQRVRKGFLDIAASDPDRFVVLDGTLSIEEIADKVVSSVGQHFNISL